MDKNEAKALLEKRQKMIDNVVNFVPQKQTPIMENLFKWKFLDTEIKPKPTPMQFLTDWDLMEKVVREHQERYSPDLAADTGTRNNIATGIALGQSGSHEMKDEEKGNLQAVDHDTFGSIEAIRDYIKDPLMFSWQRGKDIFEKGLTYNQIENACLAIKNYNDYSAHISKVMNEEYGLPTTVRTVSIAPIENVGMYFRGLKNFSIDMRRSPELLDEFNQAMAPAWLENMKSGALAPRGNSAFGDWSVLLVHSVMNNKQFERFMWNGIWGEGFKTIAENKGTSLMFIEASGLRLADYLNEVPKGVITCYFELDDPFEMRKAMPNIAFAYYPQPYLQFKTPAQAVDKAKELVEGMGPGYMYCTNKMIEHENDQKRENVFAVYEYLRNH